MKTLKWHDPYPSLLEVPDPWPKVSMRKLTTARLIPERLAFLARKGIITGDKVLN